MFGLAIVVVFVCWIACFLWWVGSWFGWCAVVLCALVRLVVLVNGLFGIADCDCLVWLTI